MVKLPRSLDALRPTKLEDYIGQDHIKDLLTTSIRAAKLRGEPLDHVLLNGPPGLGKTTLANIIAKEMGWKLKSIIGPSLGGPREVVRLLLQVEPETQLFIDEIHRVRKLSQEVMYPLLEDNKLISSLTKKELEIPPITIIGATTEVGKLEQPFIDRFGLYFQLEYYTLAELTEIIMRSAERLKMHIDQGTAAVIAQRSRGTPRLANGFLKRIRDYSDVNLQPITPEYAEFIISAKLHTDGNGLRALDHRYLKQLAKANSPVGLEALANQLHEQPETIESFIEPYLMKLGFVERRSNGRWLTGAGLAFVETLKKRR